MQPTRLKHHTVRIGLTMALALAASWPMAAGATGGAGPAVAPAAERAQRTLADAVA